MSELKTQENTILKPISWPCSPCDLNKHEFCASLRLTKIVNRDTNEPFFTEDRAKFHCSCYRENPKLHGDKKT